MATLLEQAFGYFNRRRRRGQRQFDRVLAPGYFEATRIAGANIISAGNNRLVNMVSNQTVLVEFPTCFDPKRRTSTESRRSKLGRRALSPENRTWLVTYCFN